MKKKKCVCTVYERRPRTTRTITDPRSANPVAKIEFESLGRHHLNVAEVERIAKERGYKIATTPSAVESPDVDLVLYVEPSPANSPRDVAKKSQQGRRPVTVGHSGAFGRKMQTPRG